MTAVEPILADDLSRIFADWGQPATLQCVEQSYVPETQHILEDISERTVTVIELDQTGRIANSIGGQGLVESKRLCLLSTEFEASLINSAVRFLWQNGVWGVRSRRLVWNGAVVELELLRLGAELG